MDCATVASAPNLARPALWAALVTSASLDTSPDAAVFAELATGSADALVAATLTESDAIVSTPSVTPKARFLTVLRMWNTSSPSLGGCPMHPARGQEPRDSSG